jgi:hypothetical protein
MEGPPQGIGIGLPGAVTIIVTAGAIIAAGLNSAANGINACGNAIAAATSLIFQLKQNTLQIRATLAQWAAFLSNLGKDCPGGSPPGCDDAANQALMDIAGLDSALANLQSQCDAAISSLANYDCAAQGTALASPANQQALANALTNMVTGLASQLADLNAAATDLVNGAEGSSIQAAIDACDCTQSGAVRPPRVPPPATRGCPKGTVLVATGTGLSRRYLCKLPPYNGPRE